MKNLRIIAVFLLAFGMSGCNNQKVTNKSTENMTGKDKTFHHVEWSKNANIYEVNIRQFTPEGTFKAFMPHLERLHKMGVDILWFMPINPIGEINRKGSLGSYYSVKDYQGINPEFGNLEDFKAIVEKAHLLGMHVIIDWVANHTAWDNPWTQEYPDWYKKDSTGNFESPFDWSDVISLNYENKELWKGMTNAMKYWLQEADIDGFRCDVAMLVPVDFWDSARTELDKVKPIFMLAEAEQSNLQLKAFDAYYGWEMFNTMKAVAKGEKNVEDIWKEIKRGDSLFADWSYQMLFTSNHDENTWNGTEHEMFGNATRTFGILTWVMKGFPLIYNGQEAGLNHRLKFFDKDEINWDSLWAEKFYSKLIDIKKLNPALRNGNDGGEMVRIDNNHSDKIFSFSRTLNDNTVVVMVNLSNQEVNGELDTEKISGKYSNAFTEKEIELSAKTDLHFDAWQYYVLSK